MTKSLTNTDLVRCVRKLNRASLDLLLCPMPTSDGALGGYEMEVRALDIDLDELLEECDRRGLDRLYALFGSIRQAEETA